MAKTSQVNRNKMRERMAKRDFGKRKSLKDIVMDRTLPVEDRFNASLKLAQLPMTEVASRTGYSSDVAFSRSFKRYFGLTPGEFRNCQSRYEADSQQVSIGSHPAFAFEI